MSKGLGNSGRLVTALVLNQLRVNKQEWGCPYTLKQAAEDLSWAKLQGREVLAEPVAVPRGPGLPLLHERLGLSGHARAVPVPQQHDEELGLVPGVLDAPPPPAAAARSRRTPPSGSAGLYAKSRTYSRTRWGGPVMSLASRTVTQAKKLPRGPCTSARTRAVSGRSEARMQRIALIERSRVLGEPADPPAPPLGFVRCHLAHGQG